MPLRTSLSVRGCARVYLLECPGGDQTVGMLDEADASVAAWLGRGLPPDAVISFDPPAPQESPVVNLFLYRIDSEAPTLQAAVVRMRDSDGRVTSTRLPIQRYRLSYLITAWSGDCQTEHRLLGSALRRHAQAPVLPKECLHGFLTEFDEAIPLSMASNAEAPPLHIWTELGLAVRPSLVLSFVVPVTPVTAPLTTPKVTGVDLRSTPSLDPSSASS